MTESLVIKAKVIIDTSELKSVEGLEYDGDEELYLVRVHTKTPQINFICEDVSTAKYLHNAIMKSQPVVNIQDIRKEMKQ